jgi:ribosomal protein S18 acetylase RimI-like enzyme
MTGRQEGSGVPDLVFPRYDAKAARAIRDVVAMIHRDAYADLIASGGSFESPEAFMQRFDAHTRRPLFDFVLACVDDEPVGQAWGWPEDGTVPCRQADTFEGTGTDVAIQDVSRTFALAEIMVRKAWTGKGIAHALHDEILSARTEPTAELYVRPDNENAYRAYRKWGWYKVGETRPDLPDAPRFDVLVLPLPISRGSA